MSYKQKTGNKTGEESFLELLLFPPSVPLLEGHEGLGLLPPLSPLFQSKGTQALLRGSTLWNHTPFTPMPRCKCSYEEGGGRALASPSQSLFGDSAFHKDPRGRQSSSVQLTQPHHSLTPALLAFPMTSTSYPSSWPSIYTCSQPRTDELGLASI